MKVQKYLTQKKIIRICSVASAILIIILITLLILHINNNTVIFKSEKDIQKDIGKIQKYINNNKSNEIYYEGNREIQDKVYSHSIASSNGILYLKENAEEKVKKAMENAEIGYEISAISKNELLVIEPYSGTNAISCKVISSKQDSVKITAYKAENLCESSYQVGDISDETIIEHGKDNLLYNKVKGNTTYTISNLLNSGTNIMFFFDKDKKFITKTNINTFTTPENAKYMKVITNFKNNAEYEWAYLRYCLVLGTEAGNVFEPSKVELEVSNKEKKDIYFPMESDKLVIYTDGGEIELKYVSKQN